jgi:PAS domain S-box-containing protein
MNQEARRDSSSSSAPQDYSDHSRDLSSNSSSKGTHVENSNQSSAHGVETPVGGLAQLPFSPRDLISLASNAGLNAPSPLGLPVYSASGFDLLSILARVAARPHPQIVLGPVDMACSFVVVDVRRHDRPIVYASPSFCELTGYAEHEVLGRNCRFLQSPDGKMNRGEVRKFVAQETVQHLYKSVVADKECQASIINYRKNGQAFVNLVTVIPLPGGVHNRPEEADDVVYQVGFQVDLTEQPNAILKKLRDGSYVVNYGAGTSVAPPPAVPHRDRRLNTIPPNAISKHLRILLAEPSFLESILSKSISASSTEKADSSPEGNNMLSLLLLESTPDFIHVLSLKGAFLYVAPSVRHVLGFEPDELIGKSISDYCHPADLVPLMRELKESSIMHAIGHDGRGPPNVSGLVPPKTVDLLFRAQSKSNGYLWVECRGRLHVEPGKGRKAIILSGRARNMPSLEWGAVACAGGLTPTIRNLETKPDGSPKDIEREFWGVVSVQGTILVAGAGIQDVLGWGVGEVIGKGLLGFVLDVGSGRQVLTEQLMRMREGHGPVGVACEICDKDDKRLPVQIILYHSRGQMSTSTPSPIIFQIKVQDSSYPPATYHPTRSHQANVFEELQTSHGSSWQYELQQLKFANRRLMEEADTLESSLLLHDRQCGGVQQFGTVSFPPQNMHSSKHISHDWAPPGVGEYESQRPLKRAWDSDAGPPH